VAFLLHDGVALRDGDTLLLLLLPALLLMIGLALLLLLLPALLVLDRGALVFEGGGALVVELCLAPPFGVRGALLAKLCLALPIIDSCALVLLNVYRIYETANTILKKNSASVQTSKGERCRDAGIQNKNTVRTSVKIFTLCTL
jgi:hypothetical protein